MNRKMKLCGNFFIRENTLQIASDLLGKLLVMRTESGVRVSAMIVETEAYLGEIDKAAHSFGGRRTKRNEITYSEGGHVYVYFVYGMYYQLNFVTGPAEHPHAVLIRAGEPVEGIETMRERRSSMPDKNLTSGPGKLCIAMGIDKSLNGENLMGEWIWVENYKTFLSEEISAGKRIGIDYAEEFAEKPWRFWVKGNQFVSKTR